VRNGLLLAAIAALFALAAPAAHADPLLTIAPPATTGGQIFSVPYVLSPADEAYLLTLELRAPGSTEWKKYATSPAQGAGTITTIIYGWPVFGVVEGDWQVRVTAYRSTDSPVATAEGTTRLAFQGDFGVSAPYFGDVPVGVTSGAVQLRIENTLGGPLRIRSVTAPAGSELAVTTDGCAGQTLYGTNGCYVGVTFTPAAAGTRRGTLIVDANSPKKEVYMLGKGIIDTSQPLLPYVPAPTPAPTLAPLPTTAPADEPELSFASAPGRKSTWLLNLRLTHVPAGSTVTVRCAKGCPAKRYTKRKAKGTVSLKRFATRALKAGTTIKVTLTTPGQATRTATIRVRKRRAPRVTGTL
jgi:hypothetical protein